MASAHFPLRLALDWTPNTLHTGILLAQSRGFYKEAGIDLTIISPDQDSYATTPARQLATGSVDLAICPSESIIAYQTAQNHDPARIEAIFALLGSDASSILCRPGVTRARDLDGKIYGSYNARFEDEIVRAMIRNDGGKGDVKIDQNTGKLDLFQALQDGTIDATWIFAPWEGVKADESGFEGMQLKVGDHGIEYGYSPVVAWNAGSSGLDRKALRGFAAATVRGYAFARESPEACLTILKEWCPGETVDFLRKSLESVMCFWREDGDYGRMDPEKWVAWTDFLTEQKLLKGSLDSAALFSNSFLPDSK